MIAMKPTEAVATLLREVGEGMVAHPAPPEMFAIGGRRPELFLAPANAAEVGVAVAAAGRVGLAVAPLGGGTALTSLAPPVRPYIGLLIRRLEGVVEHAADDLTVTVRAGTTSVQLAAVLEAARQRLPVDVARSEQATVGGMIATGASGPLRLGHGTLRDYLLGLAVVGADGRLVRAGGRVVKNVAGYDLMKLHTGARGTLGVVLEATFKVKPFPDRFNWVVAEAAAPAMAERVRLALAAAQVPAVALELLSPSLAAGTEAAPAAPAPWVLAVGIEGVEAEVRWQEERALEVLAAAGAPAPAVVGGAAARDFLRKIVDFGSAGSADHLVRGAVLPSRLSELVESWLALAPEATIAASAGSGVVRLGMVRAAPAILTRLRRAAVGLGGHAVVERMPASFQGEVDSWGAAAHPLAARLKAALDPGSVFLPGCYLGLGAASPAAAVVG